MATIPTSPRNAAHASPSFCSARRDLTREELEALLTYLNNIPLAPNRHLAPDGQLTEAQERGKAIFYRQSTNDGRAIPVQNRCDTCHPAETHYTARYQHRRGLRNQVRHQRIV